jgi:hypothetical protein
MVSSALATSTLAGSASALASSAGALARSVSRERIEDSLYLLLLVGGQVQILGVRQDELADLPQRRPVVLTLPPARSIAIAPAALPTEHRLRRQCQKAEHQHHPCCAFHGSDSFSKNPRAFAVPSPVLMNGMPQHRTQRIRRMRTSGFVGAAPESEHFGGRMGSQSV